MSVKKKGVKVLQRNRREERGLRERRKERKKTNTKNLWVEKIIEIGVH